MSFDEALSASTWSELVEKQPEYLSPEQYQAFTRAANLVIERLQATIDNGQERFANDEYFDFSHYIADLGERFAEESEHLDDIHQDAALTAYRVVQHLYDQLTVDSSTSF